MNDAPRGAGMVQYGLDYSTGEPTPEQVGACRYPISFLIRYIGYPGNRKCISHYPGAYVKHVAAGRTVLLVAENTTRDAAGGFPAGVAMARTAFADAKTIGYPDSLPIFFCVDGWLPTLGFTAAQAMAFFTGAASVIGAGRVGVYGFRDTIKAAKAQGIGVYRWLAGSPPTDAEVASGLTHFYQYNGGFELVGGIQCDLNWAYVDVKAIGATREDPFMSYTEAEQRELLAMVRTLHYQLVTGDGKDRFGWQTWAGGTNERLTVVDFLRRANVTQQSILTAITQLIAAVESAGVDPDLIRSALAQAFGGGLTITGKAVPMATPATLPMETDGPYEVQP